MCCSDEVTSNWKFSKFFEDKKFPLLIRYQKMRLYILLVEKCFFLSAHLKFNKKNRQEKHDERQHKVSICTQKN